MPAFRAHLLTLGLLLGLSALFGCPKPGDDKPDVGPPPPCSATDDPGSGSCTGCAIDADCAALGTGLHCDAAKRQCFKVCSSTDNLTAGTCTPCTAMGATCEDLGAGYQCNPKNGACMPPCVRDGDCASFKDGLRCDNATGQCIKGLGCFMDSSCQIEDITSYCDKYGVQCRCVVDPTDKVAGFDGVCRRRHGFCEECTKNEECGVGLVFEPPAECKTLEGGGTKKYCLHKNTDGQCGGICGRIPHVSGVCVPQSGSCDSVGCMEDKQCPNGNVCNVGKCLCESRCRWDFEQQQVAQPGCSPGTTCWVDDENLEPTSLFFGAGRCRPPCKDDNDCALSAGNPRGGPRLRCAAEKLKGGGFSEKRCRAKGECMDTLECPEQPAESITIGYCDRGSFLCKNDCRVGQDPVTSAPYQDCKTPYACTTDGGANFCRLLSCAEQGGAAIACARSQYCCGDDKNGDGMADVCPPNNLLQTDKCYDLPKPPFCTTCMSDDDCKNPQLPGWLNNACMNGSKSPNCSPLPSVCIELPNPDGMTTIKVCAPSTYNDPTRDAQGRGKDTKGCPSGYSARPIYAEPNGNDDGYCNADSDCNLGTDAGRCVRSYQVRLPDGGNGKVCGCNVGSMVQQCPNDVDAGFTSECKFGANGSEQPCIRSVVCTISATILHLDSGYPTYGCGLP
jgi:hypothetical protein